MNHPVLLHTIQVANDEFKIIFNKVFSATSEVSFLAQPSHSNSHILKIPDTPPVCFPPNKNKKIIDGIRYQEVKILIERQDKLSSYTSVVPKMVTVGAQ